jgi:cytochrome c-type biogenesis protein CcmH/NrfF
MPLAGSYCGGAMEAKQELRDLAAQGKTDQEILDAFVAKHGTWILATPPRRGFTLLAWILPMVGIVVGGSGLALFLKRARASGAQPELTGSDQFEPESTGKDRTVKVRSARASKEAPTALSEASRAQYREMLRNELGEA